jgi:hypothetical protein
MARSLSNAVQMALGHPMSAPLMDPSGAKPPLPGVQPDGRRIAADVRAPAVGLAVVGILDCLVVLLMSLLVPALTLNHAVQTDVQSVNLPQMTVTDGTSTKQVTITNGPVEQQVVTRAVGSPLLVALIPMLLLLLAFPILMIVGAVRMQQLRSYGLAMTASVIAVLPIHPWFILGLPFGVWALVVLMRRETRDAFHAREISGAAIFGGYPYDESGAIAIPPKPDAMASPDATTSLRRAGLSLILLAVPSILFCIAGCWQAINKMPSPQWVLITAVIPVVAGLLQVKAGVRMRQARCYGLCLAGATLAMLPLGSVWAFTQLPTNRIPPLHAISLTLVWLFGIVTGGRAWYVLTRPAHKPLSGGQGFDANSARPPLPHRSGGQSFAFVIPLVITMLFSLLFIVAVFSAIFAFRLRRDFNSPSVVHESMESIGNHPAVQPPPMPALPPMPEPPAAPVPAEAPDPAVPN